MEVNYLDLVGEGYMGSMQWQLGREMGIVPAYLDLRHGPFSSNFPTKIVEISYLPCMLHAPPISCTMILTPW